MQRSRWAKRQVIGFNLFAFRSLPAGEDCRVHEQFLQVLNFVALKAVNCGPAGPQTARLSKRSTALRTCTQLQSIIRLQSPPTFGQTPVRFLKSNYSLFWKQSLFFWEQLGLGINISMPLNLEAY